MRKKIIIMASLLLILLLGGVIFLMDFDNPNPSTTSEWRQEIRFAGNQTEPQTTHWTFQIPEEGNYRLMLKYLPEGSSLESLKKHPENVPAFLAGCVITDEQGRLQYATSGKWFTVDTSMDLTAGTYNLDYYYFANREDFVEFAKTYLCGSAMAENFADNIDFPSLSEAGNGSQISGTWSMEHALSIQGSQSLGARHIGILFGFLIGLCLSILIIALITKGPNLKERYDERQELERGRGYKYAFFTMLLYFLVLFAMDAAGFPLATDVSVLYCSGVFLGILVYVVYCIWHESYFALNQNARTVMIVLGLIGLANFLIGMGNLLNGTIVENGQVTFRVINLLCAGLFFSLFLTMLLKKIVSSKANAADDEEEE